MDSTNTDGLGQDTSHSALWPLPSESPAAFSQLAAACKGRILREVGALRNVVEIRLSDTPFPWRVQCTPDGGALEVGQLAPQARSTAQTNDATAGWQRWAHVLGRAVVNMHAIALPKSQRVIGIHFDCGYRAQAWLLCMGSGLMTLPELPLDFLRDRQASLMTISPSVRQVRLRA